MESMAGPCRNGLGQAGEEAGQRWREAFLGRVASEAVHGCADGSLSTPPLPRSEADAMPDRARLGPGGTRDGPGGSRPIRMDPGRRRVAAGDARKSVGEGKGGVER